MTVLRRNVIANVQCLLLALRHALKFLPLINRLINEAGMVREVVVWVVCEVDLIEDLPNTRAAAKVDIR